MFLHPHDLQPWVFPEQLAKLVLLVSLEQLPPLVRLVQPWVPRHQHSLEHSPLQKPSSKSEKPESLFDLFTKKC